MLEDIEKDYVERKRREYVDRKIGDGRIGKRKVEKDKEKENGSNRTSKGN